MMRAPAGFVPAKNLHLQYLAEHMRPDEQRNWLALTGAREYDAEVCASALIATQGLKFVLLQPNGLPAMAGGFDPQGHECYAGWMVGTMDGWGASWRSITKAARWACAEMFEAGARRITITTMASRSGACDWYSRFLGFRRDGVLRAAGAGGEDMAVYSRIAGDMTA